MILALIRTSLHLNNFFFKSFYVLVLNISIEAHVYLTNLNNISYLKSDLLDV